MKFVRYPCIALSLWLAICAVVTPVANAQSVFDVTAPVISVNEVKDGIAGETQVFTAEVTDDLGLKDVKLYIRYEGQQPYRSMAMERLGETDFYNVNVATDVNETRTMEYYVQARDEGGNRVIKGFAFQPLLRFLKLPEAAEPDAVTGAETESETVAEDQTATVQAAADEQPAEPEILEPVNSTATEAAEPEKSAGKLKWWHIALGILAVGALAGAAGGGGDGGSSSTGTVPVTITIAQP